MPVAPRALALCLLLSLSMLSGCALLDAAINDPDQAPGFDLDEVDMTQDMPDQDAPDLDMAPDLAPDMDMAPDLPPDMPDQDMDMAPDMPDMDPPCLDHPPGQGAQQARAVAVGQDFSCALLADQTVKCWGSNRYGQLGATQPGRRVTGLCEPAVAIGAGAYHACAVLASGKVACWGLANLGQLGDRQANPTLNSNDKFPFSTRAVEVSGLTNAKRVHGGEYHSCAVTQDDNVFCWGRNHRRQLGINSAGNVALTPSKLLLPQDVTASQLYVGENNACLLGSDGAVYCWGRNEYGESGQTPAPANQQEGPPTSVPTRVGGLASPARVASGSGLACAIARDQDAEGTGTNMLATLCWGGLDKLEGREDAAILTRTQTPTRQHVMPSAQELYVGSNYACVLSSAGNVECWGVNAAFQLGDAAVNPSLSLVAVKLPPGVTIDATDDTKMDIDATGTHACAVSSMGDVYCWGEDNDGRLGKTNLDPDQRPFPVKVEGL